MNGTSSESLGEGNPDSESYDKSGQTILEEISISSNDINDQDVIDYAKSIGINPTTEPFLLWIARKGLIAPLPVSWIPVQDQLGRIYFHNKVTGISTWTHPVDRYLQSFVKKKRSEQRKLLMASSNGRLNPLVNLRFLDITDDEENADGRKNVKKGVGRFQTNQNKSIGKSKREDELKLGQSLISGERINQRNDGLMLKGKNNVNTSTDVIVDQRLTLSSLDESIEDEIDSIQFELDDDAFKEIEDDGSLEEDIVTLDLTEGGPCDVKNYHEIYQIDLLTIDPNDNQPENGVSTIDGQPKRVKLERPKSGRPGSRNIKPSLEVDDDLDNYIDGDVDGDDDFSLRSLENDPFAGEGVGLFQVTRQELITLPSFPISQLETLKEEPDEDDKVKVGEDDGDEDETEFEEDESMNEGQQIDQNGRQKHELIDLIGQQANFRRLSDKLRNEISKLRDELFTVINRRSDDLTAKTVERLDGVERRLSQSEKTIHSIESDRRKNQIDSNLITTTNHGADCVNEITKVRQEVNLVTNKIDQIEENCKQLMNSESDSIRKNLGQIREEFESTMEQFRDFRKDNDLTIKALRKQLTEVSTSQDNLESLTSRTQSDLHRLSRDVNSFRQDEDEDQDNLRSEIKQMMMKERGEHDKLSQSIEEIRELVRNEIRLMDTSLRKQDEQLSKSQATINDDMSQTKSVLHYLTKELETIKQSIEEGKNLTRESEINSSTVALEEKLNQLEGNLTTINGKLEAIRVSRERERKIRMRSTNHNSNRSRKLISSCSSYEDSLSSSSEDFERNREKVNFKTRKNHPHPHHHHRNHHQHNLGTSSQQQSKIGFESGLNRHRDYIKYSPLHFSPILITSQPMDKPHRVKSTSSSLLAMIRRTSRLLQDEASDLDGLGNYRFVSDISNGLMSRNDLDADESAIRKLKQIRGDIDEKLKRLNAIVNSTNVDHPNESTLKN